MTGEFPTQKASNAENVSIWWRHHDIVWYSKCPEISQDLTVNFIWRSTVQQKLHIFDGQVNLEESVFNFAVSNVPVGGLARVGTRASAGTVMTVFDNEFKHGFVIQIFPGEFNHFIRFQLSCSLLQLLCHINSLERPLASYQDDPIVPQRSSSTHLQFSKYWQNYRW